MILLGRRQFNKKSHVVTRRMFSIEEGLRYCEEDANRRSRAKYLRFIVTSVGELEL